MSYEYALRTYVRVLGKEREIDVNKLQMHIYCFVLTESYY